MNSFFKATRQFLISHQHHLHHPRCYNTSKIFKNVDLEILSTETIKPTSPTPSHLRTFNLSIVDQCIYDVYTPVILFLPNNNNHPSTAVNDVVTKRSKHLKENLSKILTRFYPLAGKVKDNLQIECSDEGIYYVEARVNQTIKDFLSQNIDDEKLKDLLPQSPCIGESSIGNYVVGIQINIFRCGGIGISISGSHKIMDFHTFYMFLKAWAAATRGSTETITPSFVASEIFPNNPFLEFTLPSKFMATGKLATKRFVFDSTALASLKAQLVVGPHRPTRMEATTAVVWNAVAKAASKVRPFGPQSPHALLSMVNFRKRASPPLPDDSFGNLIDGASAICFPGTEIELPKLMGELRESIGKINSDYIESMKGERGRVVLTEKLRRLVEMMDVIREGDLMFVTSVLNSGIYELDFGWGKPIWLYVMNAGFARRLALTETVNGGGVEAIVTLSPQEMEIFEADPELLSYVNVNPNPL